MQYTVKNFLLGERVFSFERGRQGYISPATANSLIRSIRRSGRPILKTAAPSADLPTPPQTSPPLRSGLRVIFVLCFVFPGHLQVRNVLDSVFAPQFRSRTIKGLEGLGKVAMMEQAILKASN